MGLLPCISITYSEGTLIERKETNAGTQENYMGRNGGSGQGYRVLFLRMKGRITEDKREEY